MEAIFKHQAVALAFAQNGIKVKMGWLYHAPMRTITLKEGDD